MNTPQPAADASAQPVTKNCRNCGHHTGSSYPGGHCGLSGFYAETERRYPTACGLNFSGWKPLMPRRSFRRWFIDTFLS